MSAQLPDRFFFEGREYDVARCTPHRPLSALGWGLEPYAPHTGCQRGTLAGYRLVGDDLQITELRYWTRQRLPPVLAGQSPIQEEDPGGRPGLLYTDLNTFVPWSGELLLGRGFQWELLRPRGFQAPWKYREVMHLVFDEGHLRAFGNVSKKMAQLRTAVQEISAAVGF
ncbi:MAG: hypothetical protein IPP35_05495 [Elusimicrobia bacterium]|nr:hypothetical protein [Elusimicrobiota bacterium]